MGIGEGGGGLGTCRVDLASIRLMEPHVTELLRIGDKSFLLQWDST